LMLSLMGTSLRPSMTSLVASHVRDPPFSYLVAVNDRELTVSNVPSVWAS
jgi:hypothetical protein